MHPLLPFSLKKESNLRSSPSLPTPSIESSLASNFTFASSGSVSSLAPKTPPNSLLLDLDPPKPASSAPTTSTKTSNNAYGQSASSSCAYPSWPNRPLLVSTQASTTTTSTAVSSPFSTASSSAYISDEELLDTTPLSSPAIEVDHDPCATLTTGMDSISMSAELRIRHMREQAEEEEDRARFLAQVQAHARAQLATRLQLPQQHQQQQQQQYQQQQGGTNAATLRAKQRKAIIPVVGKKRRATSSSSKKGYPRV